MTSKEKQEMLLPAYLINGEDELKRLVVLKRLKARVESLGDLSFNYDIFRGNLATGADIVAACNTMPFASEMRLVQVNDVDLLKKADAEALIDYLDAANPSTVLALLSNKLAKNTRLYKAVSAQGLKAIIDCAPQKRYELARSLRALAVGHGITLTDGAAQALINLVGENTVYLDNELKKLALSHRGNDAVSDSEVKAMVLRTTEVKPWEFVDAFAARETEKVLCYLQSMDSTSPHALLALCTTRLRELICAHSLHERGNPQSLARTLKMPDWRVKNHFSWAQNFSSQELRQALISARDTEQAMKSGTDPRDAFLNWILQIMKKKR